MKIHKAPAAVQLSFYSTSLFLLMDEKCFSPKKGFFCFLAQEIAWILPSVPRTPNPPGTRTPLHESEEILFTRDSPHQHGSQQPRATLSYTSCKNSLLKRALKCPKWQSLSAAQLLYDFIWGVTKYLEGNFLWMPILPSKESQIQRRLQYSSSSRWMIHTLCNNHLFANASSSPAHAKEATGCSHVVLTPGTRKLNSAGASLFDQYHPKTASFRTNKPHWFLFSNKSFLANSASSWHFSAL